MSSAGANALKPYPEYRDSGLPWLGRIPSHWKEKRAKYYFREVDERSTTGAEQLMSVSHVTGVTPRKHNVTMFMAESNVGHKICCPGDLVINTMWAWMAALGVARQTGLVSPSYGVYRPRNPLAYVPDYVDHLLRTQPYASEYLCRSTGIRASRLRLYPDDFLDIRIVRPPPEEQEAMVRFIAHHNRLVHLFIRNRRRLIELLIEQKQAIINRAVTRGLDPNAPLKPSGIEWLGDVPEHWEISPLKRVTKLIAGGATPESSKAEYWNGEVVWATPTDVSKHDVLTDSERRLTQAGLASCSAVVVPAGSIVLTSRAPVGNTAIAAVPLCTNQGCKAIVPVSLRLNSEYLLSQLKVMKPHLQNVATGTTFTEIDTWGVANQKIAVPPLREQDVIVGALKEEAIPVDAAIWNAQRGIDLTREFRTRLIADVVTGKVDVRHLAPEAVEPLNEVEEVSEDNLPEAEDAEVVEEAPDADDR